MVYEHRPVHENGRDQWLVSHVDPETGAKTPLGIRPQSAANALDGAVHAGNRVTSIEVRDRTAPGTPVQSYDLTPDPARPLEARVLPGPGSLFHDRSHCGPCAAERGHDVNLPTALPSESVR
jgi:hypothetical protein